MDQSAKRRQTTASLDGNGGGFPGRVSGGGGRPSLTGGAPQRVSLGPARASLRGSLGAPCASDANGGMAGAAAGMATPALAPGKRQSQLASVSRRSSANVPRASIFGSRGTVVDQDPRPLRDKSWQQNTNRNIVDYLTNAGYSLPLSTKTLQMPTSKDFQAIFKFLCAKIDPNLVFQKKFEEEVPAVLKALKYPYTEQISKSQLYAVGSMHSWPTLLAMLGWLVELNLCLERIYDDSEAEASVGFSQEFGTNCGGQAPRPAPAEKFFFDYLRQAYQLFLVGDDNFAPIEEEMAKKFDSLNQDTTLEIQRLEKANEQLNQQISAMGADQPPLEALEKQGKHLQSDHKKLKEYIHHLENKMAKLKEQNSRTMQELSSTASQIAQLRAEKAQVQAVVDAQELSPADVDRMAAEREELRNQIAAVLAHQVQANKTAWEKEIAVQRLLDTVERLVAAYNRLVSTLRLECNEEFVTVVWPSGPAVVGDEDEGGMHPSRRFCVMKVNVHATRADAMVSLDLRNKIKPALQMLREKMTTLAHSSENEVINLSEELERLNDQIADKKDELASLQQRLDQAAASYTEQKKACTQIAVESNSQMKSMEAKLSVMKREGSGELITAKQRKQNMTMEHDNLVQKSQEKMDSVSKEFLQILNELEAFKSRAEQGIAEMERSVAEELEAARRAMTASI